MAKKRLRMDSPAHYRILVQGVLDPKWEQRLGGLSSSLLHRDQMITVTQLAGELMDQAALFGVLNTLYGLQLPLISVLYLTEDDCCGECQ